MNAAELDTAITTRARVRISERSGYHKGIEGILLGYRENYGNVKVGFIDADGKYTGDYTVVPLDCVELVADAITLEIHICDQRRSYLATFATEAQAIAFMERKRSTHAFHQVEGRWIPDECTDLLDYLFPTCEHGLSASLCSGPMHY